MSTDIVRAQPAAPAHYDPNVLSAQMEYAKAMASSDLLPRQYQGKPANLLWAISYGQTLGVAPLTAVQSIHVINGKPTASADLIAGLVRRAGHKLRVNGDDRRAVAQIIRADDPDFTFEVVWTIERAQAAKLTGKDTWKNFPAAMLKARAITEVARAACSEILQGTIYTPEELGANVDADGIPVEAPVQQLRRVQPGEADPWATTTPVVTTEQKLANAAGLSSDPVHMRDLYRQAKEAGLLAATVKVDGETQELGAYLIARGQQLAEPTPKKPDPVEAGPAPYSMSDAVGAAGGIDGAFADDMTDAEVVAEGEAEADIAERGLRAAAAKAGLDNLDEEFQRSYGLPIAEAGVQQLREMTGLLTGNAA